MQPIYYEKNDPATLNRCFGMIVLKICMCCLLYRIYFNKYCLNMYLGQIHKQSNMACDLTALGTSF